VFSQLIAAILSNIFLDQTIFKKQIKSIFFKSI